MRFTKMHGIGNDYVYLDGFAESAPADPAKLAVAVSDRHFGVGSDGLILILPSTVADARMRMFNADGSESEMCGNGLRCVAKYVHDHNIARRETLKIETGRGVLSVRVNPTPGVGGASEVEIDMGRPILAPADVPTTLGGAGGGPAIDAPLTVGGREFKVTAVSVGNPHAVIHVDPAFLAPSPRDLVAEYGAQIEVHPAFPRRVNVHFVAVHSPSEVTMRTWERGTGLTLACGTGASAVAVAGVLTGRTGRALLAHLPGGDLWLEWPADDASVKLTGPAVEVFRGEWPGTAG